MLGRKTYTTCIRTPYWFFVQNVMKICAGKLKTFPSQMNKCLRRTNVSDDKCLRRTNVSDEQMSNEQVSDEQMSNEQVSDEQMSNEQVSDEQVSQTNKCLTNKCPTNKRLRTSVLIPLMRACLIIQIIFILSSSDIALWT